MSPSAISSASPTASAIYAHANLLGRKAAQLDLRPFSDSDAQAGAGLPRRSMRRCVGFQYQYQWAPLRDALTRPSIPRPSPMCTHTLSCAHGLWTLEYPAGDASAVRTAKRPSQTVDFTGVENGAAAAPTGLAILRSRTQDLTRREERS